MSDSHREQVLTYRSTAQNVRAIRQVAAALNVPVSQLLRLAVDAFLARPGVQRLSQMSLEDRVMWQNQNVNEGRHRNAGIELE